MPLPGHLWDYLAAFCELKVQTPPPENGGGGESFSLLLQINGTESMLSAALDHSHDKGLFVNLKGKIPHKPKSSQIIRKEITQYRARYLDVRVSPALEFVCQQHAHKIERGTLLFYQLRFVYSTINLAFLRQHKVHQINRKEGKSTSQILSWVTVNHIRQNNMFVQKQGSSK